MSSISSLKLESAIGGETTYTSPITDLLRYNSLSYSAFYIHASLPICNLKVYFSNTTANEDFKLYSEITLDNEVRATGNLLIPSRYVKFTMENPAPDAMEDVDVVFTAHKTATSNIDVNIGADDITISGMATESTQQLVKGLLDDVKLNTTRVKTTDNVADAIPVRLVCGINGEFYNPLRAIGNDLSVYIDEMNPDVAVNSGLSTKALQETGNASLTSIDSKIVTCDTDDVGEKLDTLSTQATTQIGYLTSIDSKITEVNTNDVSITNSVLPTGGSSAALQTTGNDYLNSVVLQTTETNNKLATANATLDNIKLDTANLVRVAPTDNNVQQAIPVRLMVGTSGAAFNALRSVNGDLATYVDDMNPDVAVNSGLSTKALQETANTSLTSIDSKIVTCDTDDVGEKLDTLNGQATTQISYLTSIDSKITEVNTADVTVTSSVLPTGGSTSALQTTGNDYLNNVVLQTTDINSNLATANTTLDDIKTNTDNLVRVTPTTNVTEAIPVRLMVGTSGSSFNALRSIGSDLGVYVDDMNVDAVNNSGMSKASLQTDGNNTLTTISSTLTTMDTVLDNIDTGINKAVTTAVLYNNVTVTSGTTTTTINMGTGKDRYNTIQVIGSSVTNGFDFRFDFSIDATNWYSDGVFSTHYNNGATYEFVVSRLNVSVPYIRIHAGSTTGNNVYMSYSLSKE